MANHQQNHLFGKSRRAENKPFRTVRSAATDMLLVRDSLVASDGQWPRSPSYNLRSVNLRTKGIRDLL